MIRRLIFMMIWLVPLVTCNAQGPLFDQSNLMTLPYEDLSDLLRRYPGMYPQDFGTLGTPIVFRPWNGQAWNLQTSRDGIPQNRRYDGFYDSNLQPGSELQTIDYRFLSGDPAGRFNLTTRYLPLDSPYTEFQIREGYYGYGTVDFAHGQRAYRSLTVQVTGRLGWYNGLRDTTASRFNRLRGQIGFDIGDRWHSEVTYSGSKVEAEDIALIKRNCLSERSEGIASLDLKDSIQASIRPSLKLFLRQDREKWSNGFRAWEQTGGWIAGFTLHQFHQYLRLRHVGMIADMIFPGISKRRELSLDISLSDSIETSLASFELFGGIKRESAWDGPTESDQVHLMRGGVEIATRPYWNLSLLAGVQYSEQAVPILWRAGHYRIGDRPLYVDPLFTANESVLVTGTTTAKSADRYLNSMLGIRWQRNSALIDLRSLVIHRPGDFENRFEGEGSDIRMICDRRTGDDTHVGAAVSSIIPLWYGLRIDSWWFGQVASDDMSTVEDWRGYSRLYFERQFFQSHLTIRSHISYEEIGRRQGFSDRGKAVLGPDRMLGFRISATIRGVTLIWGTENFFKEYYSYLPGYTMIAKEEYLAFVWRLWL